jgi:hypothetical protein
MMKTRSRNDYLLYEGEDEVAISGREYRLL